MEVKVQICKNPTETQMSLGITDVSTDFLAEAVTTLTFQKYRKSDLKCIDVLVYKNLDTETIKQSVISDVGETNSVTVPNDGWYVISHILLPTKTWFDFAQPLGGVFDTYAAVYYIDTATSKYYKYVDSASTEVTLKEVVDRNVLNTTISSYVQNYFSVFYLLHCYITVSEKLLTANIKCSNDNLKELTFDRDVIWMTVNIINYYVSLNDLDGATLLLNRLDFCNGLCRKVNVSLTSSSGCGCSK